MAWIESNMERLRSISDKTGRIAGRAAASKEASKNRLFSSVSNLTSGILDRREAERGREHESEMEMQRQGGSENLQRMRDEAAMERQRETQNWTDKQRVAAEKAVEGMPDWNPDLYEGSWTDHNGKTWTWGSKQEYDLIKQDIMNEAAERAAAARNERDPTDWFPIYEQVAGDMMKNNTDIWDSTTGEFIGWDAVEGGKDALLEQFVLGVSNRKDLTEEQRQSAIDYFASYLDDIEDGTVPPPEVDEGGEETIVDSDEYAEYTWVPDPNGTGFIQLRNGVPVDEQEPLHAGGTGEEGAVEREVSPIVKNFYGEVEKLKTIEPETTFMGNEDKQAELWRNVQNTLSTLTAADLSTLNDSDEKKLGMLVRSGTADNKMYVRELERMQELLNKVTDNVEMRNSQLNRE